MNLLRTPGRLSDVDVHIQLVLLLHDRHHVGQLELPGLQLLSSPEVIRTLARLEASEHWPLRLHVHRDPPHYGRVILRDVNGLDEEVVGGVRVLGLCVWRESVPQVPVSVVAEKEPVCLLVEPNGLPLSLPALLATSTHLLISSGLVLLIVFWMASSVIDSSLALICRTSLSSSLHAARSIRLTSTLFICRSQVKIADHKRMVTDQPVVQHDSRRPTLHPAGAAELVGRASRRAPRHDLWAVDDVYVRLVRPLPYSSAAGRRLSLGHLRRPQRMMAIKIGTKDHIILIVTTHPPPPAWRATPSASQPSPPRALTPPPWIIPSSPSPLPSPTSLDHQRRSGVSRCS